MLGVMAKLLIGLFYICTGGYLIYSVKKSQGKLIKKSLYDIRQDHADMCSGLTLIAMGIVIWTLM